MTKDEIRSAFIDFFQQRDHALLPNVSLIPDDDTVLLTSAGVQQVQPFFLGLARPPAPRLVNVQRCLRTVDIEEVGDDSHLTLFEMMGNWSIGDYFKREAIAWSWELMGQIGFDRRRVWASVYQGTNGRDDEAYELWRETGVPAERIVFLGDEHNWWAPGDTGPCGPDTEMFYDRGEELGCGRSDCKPGCECGRFLEFWNDVFTQYNREVDGSLTVLPSKNVDTGAGLERWAMLLQGQRSVYETDCFWPLIEALSAATHQDYGADPRTTRTLRIIADHGRALTFLISDGVVPTPEGRGSVLRLLLRRAVLHGRLLGLRRPFLKAVVVPAVVAMMKGGYPELEERQDYIAEIADTEEKQFLSTIERGIVLAEELLDRAEAARQPVDGEDAFNLRQTHGFPLELLRDLARQRGLAIDTEGYEKAAERHRAASASDEGFFAAARNNKAYGEIAERLGRTPEFLGYDTLEAAARVVGIVKDGEAVSRAAPGDAVQVVLDRTPFYAESGGQVGDTGTISVDGATVRVTDTQRPKGSVIVVHIGTVEGGPLRVGDGVVAQVDAAARTSTAQHHSATHLVHYALKNALGEGVHQEGSVVEPRRFTFDFNLPRAMTPAELAAVEREVNGLIRADYPVETELMHYADAIRDGAMALFTEKYGDTVRVVTMGPSRELCGGTHVRRTGEIGAFFIQSESSVSAGIRRIECVAGEIAYLHARGQIDDVRNLARELEAQPSQLPARVAALRDGNRALERLLNDARQEIANLKVRNLIGGGSAAGSVVPILVESVDGFRAVVQRVEAGSADDLKSQSDVLKGRYAPCVVVLGAAVDGRAVFTAAATQGLDAKGVRAGDLVRAAATAAGGKGGGSPTWAQGSAPDAEKIDHGLEAARLLLRQLGD